MYIADLPLGTGGNRALKFVTRNVRYTLPQATPIFTPQTRTVIVQGPATDTPATYTPGVQQITGSSGPTFKSGPYQPDVPRVVSVPTSQTSESEPLLVEYATETETENDLTSGKGYGIAIAALVILALILLSRKGKRS